MSCYRPSWRKKGEETKQGKTWVVEFTDHRKIRRVLSTSVREKESAQAIERKVKRLVDLRSTDSPLDEDLRRWVAGIPPWLRDRIAAFDLLSTKDTHAAKTLTELVATWRQSLADKGTSRGQERGVGVRALKLFAGIGAVYWHHIDAMRAETWLREQRDGTRDLSARTSNSYLLAARQFCAWAVRAGLALSNPLLPVHTTPTRLDRRYIRRCLDVPELERLMAATIAGPERDRVPGTTRALIYTLAAETGLRKNEIKTLVVGNFDLADPAHARVCVEARHAKNRREAWLPIRPALAVRLAAAFAGRLPMAPAFDLPRAWHAAEWVRADLTLADIEHADAAGRVVDFHSFRASMATNLFRAGVGIATVQKLMRHSDARLTTNVYAIFSDEDLHRAVGMLPDYSPRPIAAWERLDERGRRDVLRLAEELVQ